MTRSGSLSWVQKEDVGKCGSSKSAVGKRVLDWLEEQVR